MYCRAFSCSPSSVNNQGFFTCLPLCPSESSPTSSNSFRQLRIVSGSLRKKSATNLRAGLTSMPADLWKKYNATAMVLISLKEECLRNSRIKESLNISASSFIASSFSKAFSRRTAFLF
eukprot:Pompholyxophrys_punicea_v1_NODE_639_length_1542_cov_24.574311.p2 type:complete len:119 gc:universal NODE_639_length_1542_cov_24.574311:826-470(-)